MTGVRPGVPGTLTVSVVIPVRNEAHRIGDCLRALDRQAIPPVEVIVIDNGSTDDTKAVVRTLMEEASTTTIVLLEESKRGAAAARNRGTSRAAGDVVAFTDADCVPALDWIKQITRAFEDAPGLGGVGGIAISKGGSRSLVGQVLTATWLPDTGDEAPRVIEGKNDWFHGTFLSTFNCAFRRKHLADLRGFDESLTRVGEDMDLWIRANEAGVRMTSWDPRIRVEHNQDMSVRAMLRKMYHYGIGLTLVTGLHFRGVVVVQQPFSRGCLTGRELLTVVLWRHTTQALLVALLLAGIGVFSASAAMVFIFLGLGALGLRLRRRIVRDGSTISVPGLAAVVGLYLARLGVREIGMIRGSLRYGVVSL